MGTVVFEELYLWVGSRGANGQEKKLIAYRNDIKLLVATLNLSNVVKLFPCYFDGDVCQTIANEVSTNSRTRNLLSLVRSCLNAVRFRHLKSPVNGQSQQSHQIVVRA